MAELRGLGDTFVVADIPEQRQLLDESRGRRAFPLTLTPRNPTSAAELVQRIKDNDAYLRHLTMIHGAVLLRGCDVNSAEDFGGVAGALNCAHHEYIGGTALRTEVVPGLVYTANEAPPDQQIAFHHENAMAKEPPTYILFFCETPPTDGGATPIVHSEEVAAFLEATHPDFAQKVALLGVRYIRVMPEETDRSSFFGASWKECYNVSTRSEAEEAMTKQGTSYEWLPNGDCRTTTKAFPGFRLDARTGKRAFFNSMYGVFTGWNNSRNSGEKAVVFGDGSPIDAEVMRSLGCFIKERQVAFKWKQGDVLVIDNSLVMHSRETFTPPRQILASLRGKPNAQSVEAGPGDPELSQMFHVVDREAGMVRDDLPIWGLKAGVPIEEAFPLSCVSAVEKHEVADVRGAFQLLNLLSRDESSQFIRVLESLGFHSDGIWLVAGGNGHYNPVPEKKGKRNNCELLIPESVDRAVFQRCQHLLPTIGGCRPLGLNGKWRCYKYVVGDHFNPHKDGSWSEIRVRQGKMIEDAFPDRRSQLTFLIYLNENFEGAATRFCKDCHDQAGILVRTPAGGALCFPHGLHPDSPYHTSELLHSGVKYIIRTEVMYHVDALREYACPELMPAIRNLCGSQFKENLEDASTACLSDPTRNSQKDSDDLSAHLADPSQVDFDRQLCWRNTLAAIMLTAHTGLTYGTSTWIKPLNHYFLHSGWKPGVVLPAIYMAITYGITFPLVGHVVHKDILPVSQLPYLALLAIAYPFFIGVATSLGALWPAYLGMGIGSLGLGAVMQIEKVVAVQWWAAAGKARWGKAIMGFALGAWTVFFTLASALIIHALSLPLAMWLLSAFLAMSSLYPLWLKCQGKFQAPRTSQKGSSSDNKQPVFQSLSFLQLALHLVILAFVGGGMKALLSPIFETTYQTSYLVSAYLAAGSVSLFTVCKGLSPLVAGQIPLCAVSAGLLLLDTVLYFCNPWIVSKLSVHWLMASKTITGACFGGLQSLTAIIALETFGPTHFGKVWPMLSIFIALGFGAGPLAGYYISLSQAGTSESYDPFFYLCSGLTALGALNLAALGLRTRAAHQPAQGVSHQPWAERK